MSNKKETPVSWLAGQLESITQDLFDKALQMEDLKQQKYDEMLAMLEVCKQTTSRFDMHKDLEQLIKEAKEL
jgi:hypothetical protein